MGDRRRYRKRADQFVVAVKLDLDIYSSKITFVPFNDALPFKLKFSPAK